MFACWCVYSCCSLGVQEDQRSSPFTWSGNEKYFFTYFNYPLTSAQTSLLKQSVLMKYLIFKSFLCCTDVFKNANSICKIVALTCVKPRFSHLLCTLVNIIWWPLVPVGYLVVAQALVPGPRLGHSLFLILQQISWASFLSLQRVLGHPSGSTGWITHYHTPLAPQSCEEVLVRRKLICPQLLHIFDFAERCQATSCSHQTGTQQQLPLPWAFPSPSQGLERAFSIGAAPACPK